MINSLWSLEFALDSGRIFTFLKKKIRMGVARIEPSTSRSWDHSMTPTAELTMSNGTLLKHWLIHSQVFLKKVTAEQKRWLGIAASWMLSNYSNEKNLWLCDVRPSMQMFCPEPSSQQLVDWNLCWNKHFSKRKFTLKVFKSLNWLLTLSTGCTKFNDSLDTLLPMHLTIILVSNEVK